MIDHAQLQIKIANYMNTHLWRCWEEVRKRKIIREGSGETHTHSGTLRRKNQQRRVNIVWGLSPSSCLSWARTLARSIDSSIAWYSSLHWKRKIKRSVFLEMENVVLTHRQGKQHNNHPADHISIPKPHNAQSCRQSQIQLSSIFVRSTHAFGVELAISCLVAFLGPQAQHLRFRDVSDINYLFEPPTFDYGTCDASQYQTIITHLKRRG